MGATQGVRKMIDLLVLIMAFAVFFSPLLFVSKGIYFAFTTTAIIILLIYWFVPVIFNFILAAIVILILIFVT
jgi:hypothetical protein